MLIPEILINARQWRCHPRFQTIKFLEPGGATSNALTAAMTLRVDLRFCKVCEGVDALSETGVLCMRRWCDPERMLFVVDSSAEKGSNLKRTHECENMFVT